MFALIADIGGTNIRLALVNKDAEILFAGHYKCSNYPSLSAVIKEYLTTLKVQPKHAVIAVAAAIMGDHIVMTNHSWEFSISKLAIELNLDSLKIINDFEAQAMAVEHLAAADIKVIHGEIFEESVCRNIAGPGTGFGNALLYQKNGAWNILPTEAGHCVIGSCSPLEDEIFKRVKMDSNTKEPYGELFVSGGGILRIYNALKEINGISGGFTTTLDISANAESDATAKQTMEVFYGLLGTLLANIALSYLPYGGIYLTGGIIPQTLNTDMEKILIDRFLDRKLDTVKAILYKIPLAVITRENPAMLGLAKHVSSII